MPEAPALETLPAIVVIDEFASDDDRRGEGEELIARIAQKLEPPAFICFWPLSVLPWT